MPGNYRGATGVATVNSLADLPWWNVYKDETLKELIRAALANNYDVRIAVTRVEQSRALAAQARAQFFPFVTYQGQANAGPNQEFGSISQLDRSGTGEYIAGNVSWELDLWGQIRRMNEAARAQFLATEEAQHAVMLSLVADVATAYLELLELDAELEIARSGVDSFGRSLKLFSTRLAGGAASKLETSSAEAELASVAATIPDLERRIALKENQINVLLGRGPADVPRRAALSDQTMPPDVPAGLPSALLERRPDVRRAEQLLRSANAQVGVSVTNFFPQLNLTGLLGRLSPEYAGFANPTWNAWMLGGSLTGPLFEGGRLRAQYRQAVAAWEQAKLQYQQTALIALLEVSNALISREKLEGVRAQLERAVAAYQEAVKVSMQRFREGRASYYEVLLEQQQLFPAENALAQTRLNQLLAIVQLYEALGGGWQTEQVEGPHVP
jgi:multidrug efflux system outer membrane protein